MKRRSLPGFTLVEVVLAVAVVAFCLVTLLALFTSGLLSSRKSTEDTRLAALTWTVANEIQTNRFNTVANNGYSNYFSGYTNYYDARGLATNAANAYYTYKIIPVTLVGTNSGQAATAPTFLTNSLQMVAIKTSRISDPLHVTTNYVLLSPP